MSSPSSLDISDTTLTTDTGTVRVRVYRPMTQSPARTGLVWVHGGAFVHGDIDMPEADWVAKEIAASGRAVVSVDYTLCDASWLMRGEPPAPDSARFPTATREVVAAFRWASGNVPGVNQWYLGGASAGGNLSLGAAQILRDEGGACPYGLVLIYPVVHAELPPLSEEIRRHCDALADQTRILTPDMVSRMSLGHVGDQMGLHERYAFPGEGDLANLPPVFVLNAEADSLRASGQRLVADLAAAGGDVMQVREPGTAHGHLNEPDLPEAATSMGRILAWMAMHESVH
ncbi:MAG: alpha/beta hydrolase fold domain-containing protein [Actinomycetaceae bacterium]|nr:alpha/beta hydrolase fold domain-containing protein [Actinomycetaceae bacterium]